MTQTQTQTTIVNNGHENHKAGNTNTKKSPLCLRHDFVNLLPEGSQLQTLADSRTIQLVTHTLIPYGFTRNCVQVESADQSHNALGTKTQDSCSAKA